MNKNFFRDLSYRKKVICICLIISLIPVMLLGYFSYTQQKRQLINREELAIRETLNSETNQLNNKLAVYINALNLIAWNENIRNALTQTYTTNFEMYQTYKDTIDPLFLTISSLNTDISNICIYTNHAIYPHGSILNSLDKAKDLPWYQEASSSLTPVFKLSKDKHLLYLACKIHINSNETNLLCITIKMSKFLQSTHSLFRSDYGFQILDSKQTVLYQYLSDDKKNSKMANLDSSFDKNNANYITEKSFLSPVSWSCHLYRSISGIKDEVNQLKYIVLLIMLLCVLFVFFSSAAISNIIVSPLEKLAANIAQVEKGNYEITVASNSNDEVGKLIQAFHSMTIQLNHLINEVLLAKIAQQANELKILQLQINPHFLYNSLSLINGKAIMTGQNDISQMAQLLSTFYRTMLNKGKNFISIENELKNVKAYIKLQQIMHSYSFNVIYDIDPNTFSYYIPNLVLQPLAENAILHGLDHKETPGEKIMTISIHMTESDILLVIMDNGCGMTLEECDTILTSKSRGYGVSNVQQRIQLYYGDSYGLSYRSTPTLGTSVTLKIKKENQPQQES